MPRKKKSSGSCENHRLSSLSSNREKPVQRNAANARERARMRVLSRAFCRLKTTLPWVPADTKLSKLDTLRLAASYIAHLKGILREDPFSSEDSIHPAMNLTWPFGFNRGGGNGSGGGGSGSEEDAESGSSCAWEEVTKDCVHLDQEDDPTLQLHPHHHHHHHLESSTHLHHSPHNLHHSHHHHQHHPSDDPTDPLSYSRTNPQQQPSSSPSAANMIPGNFYRDDVMSIG